MIGDLRESEKQWMRLQMRKYGPLAAMAAKGKDEWARALELCADDVMRFIRLTEQLLLLLFLQL